MNDMELNEYIRSINTLIFNIVRPQCGHLRVIAFKITSKTHARTYINNIRFLYICIFIEI